MRMGRRGLTALLAAVLLFTGCQSRQSTAEDEATGTVYYLNKEEDALLAVEYEEREGDTAMHVSDLFSLMNQVTAEDNYRRLLPEDVSVNSCVLDGTELVIDFSASYKEMEKTREVLVRAGIVRTMIQVDGVTSVRFTVAGEEAAAADGVLLGSMTEDSFVEGSGRMVNAIQHTSIILYFTSADGTALQRESRSIYYSAGKPLEWAVVERIIAGPKVEGNYATVPSNLQIIGVTTANGICYVNLNNTFETSPLTVDVEIPIYSIVNSICENCSEVKGVQFAIEGDSNVVFRSSVDLSRVFTPDLSRVVE